MVIYMEISGIAVSGTWEVLKKKETAIIIYFTEKTRAV